VAVVSFVVDTELVLANIGKQTPLPMSMPSLVHADVGYVVTSPAITPALLSDFVAREQAFGTAVAVSEMLSVIRAFADSLETFVPFANTSLLDTALLNLTAPTRFVGNVVVLTMNATEVSSDRFIH
jgi:hypothetical protein